MASGRSHDIACQVAGLFLLPLAFRLSYSIPEIPPLGGIELAFLYSGYIIGSVWLSPDIDLKQSQPSKRMGFLNPLWKPYRKLSRHRGFSHIPLIGTASRIAYVGFLTIPVLLLIHLYSPNTSWELLSFLDQSIGLKKIPGLLLFGFTGLEISAWVHLIMDYCPGLRKL
jgi:uncharacterized metal-binding protein